MKTKLTQLLGIKYPIIQGPMAWVSDSSLVSAVSNAGGAGTLAAGGQNCLWLEEEIKKTRELTKKPFGVNIVLMDENKDELFQVALDQKVDFITLSAGNPLPYLDKIKEAGIISLVVVPNLRLAKRVEDHGADIIIIEGLEAGGHIGKESSLALMTQVIPEIKVPVVAAGGFADGRGLAAAFIMGASGIQMGTRFYAAKEANVHKDTKNALIAATKTLVVGSQYGRDARALKNNLTTRCLELEKSGAPLDEVREVLRGSAKRAPLEGDIHWGSIQAGQSVYLIKSIDSSEEIIEGIIKEARNLLENPLK